VGRGVVHHFAPKRPADDLHGIRMVTQTANSNAGDA
jgi:hypothetical protein